MEQRHSSREAVIERRVGVAESAILACVGSEVIPFPGGVCAHRRKRLNDDATTAGRPWLRKILREAQASF